MAEIYVAEMTLVRGVKRRVALKRIHSHLAEDPHFVTMFLDEARVASQLQHAGVVPVRDVIEVEGELLLVLDYVPGWDLASILRRARERGELPSIAHAIYVGRAIAETLDYVHGAVDLAGKPLGIVHRDVNPSNIHVAEDGAVRLLDFGVAKAAARMTHTATPAIKGKLAYLAPEQAKNEALDGRADLYGLGLIMFEMITGARAMKAEGELLLLELARAPKLERVGTLRAGVPQALEDVVSRLLAIDRGARPARGGDVASVLRALEDPGAAAGLRAWIGALMGSGARPIREAQRPLDVALRAIAGIELDEIATRARAAEKTAEKTAEITAEETAEKTAEEGRTVGTPVSAAGRRNLLFAGAGLALILGTVASLSGGTEPVARSPSFLRITSEPAGAEIAIDGRASAEKTPAIIDVGSSTMARVALVRADHQRAERAIACAPGATTDAHFALVRTKGRARIAVEPVGARIFLDDRDAGAAPLDVEDLPREVIAVRAEADGFHSQEASIDLREAAEASLELTLEPRVLTGTIDISSTPWARVWIDGRVVAESTPVIGLRLKTGRHTVLLKNPRTQQSARRIVEIKAREKSSLIVELGR